MKALEAEAFLKVDGCQWTGNRTKAWPEHKSWTGIQHFFLRDPLKFSLFRSLSVSLYPSSLSFSFSPLPQSLHLSFSLSLSLLFYLTLPLTGSLLSLILSLPLFFILCSSYFLSYHSLTLPLTLSFTHSLPLIHRSGHNAENENLSQRRWAKWRLDGERVDEEIL